MTSMNLSVDAIRQDITERRDVLARLHPFTHGYKQAIERLEQELAQARVALAAHEARMAHEARSIAALEAAVAVLTERLPDGSGDVSVPESPAHPQSPVQPQVSGPQEHHHQGLRDPLHVTPKSQNGRRTSGPRAIPQGVFERANELDMATVTQSQLERADLVFMLIEEAAGPQNILAARLAPVMECSEHTATSIVSRALPLLVRQNRVVAEGEVMGTTLGSKGLVWRVAPSQAASAHLGVEDDNYEGGTTRWPSDSTAPAKGTRIEVNPSSYEQGKKR